MCLPGVQIDNHQCFLLMEDVFQDCPGTFQDYQGLLVLEGSLTHGAFQDYPGVCLALQDYWVGSLSCTLRFLRTHPSIAAVDLGCC